MNATKKKDRLTGLLPPNTCTSVQVGQIVRDEELELADCIAGGAGGVVLVDR